MVRAMIAKRAAHYEENYLQQGQQLLRRLEMGNTPTQQTDAIRLSGIFRKPPDIRL